MNSKRRARCVRVEGEALSDRHRRAFIGAAAATALGGFAGRSPAQADYPARMVRLVVPFPPGGLSDALARLYGKELSERFGQPFVPDYKPGAATNLGAAQVAQAAPDGYTLLVTTIATNALNRWSTRKLSFDPHAFTEIGMLGVNTLYLMVAADSPYRSVADLVKAARANPTAISFGTHGAGGPNHLITELLRTQAGIGDWTHVPYKGLPQSSLDLIGGRIDFMIDGAAINLVQAGRLRALAVAYPTRWPTQPDIPTMAEAGFPDVTMTAFFGIAAPQGTPPAIVDKLNTALRQIAQRADIERAMLGLNVIPLPLTAKETGEFIRAQSDKWRPVVKSLNISFN